MIQMKWHYKISNVQYWYKWHYKNDITFVTKVTLQNQQCTVMLPALQMIDLTNNAAQ